MKFKLTYDIEEFKKNADNLLKHITTTCEILVKKAANVFASTAARVTPPKGAAIPKEKYQRPYLILRKLVNNRYNGIVPTSDDISAYNHGFQFKVLDTKYPHSIKNNIGHKNLNAYCRTLNEVKKVQRISNRGLNKVMWGLALDNVEADVPVVINRLVKKSPHLNELKHLTDTKMYKDEDKVVIEITNRGEYADRFGFAVNAGKNAAQRNMKWALIALIDKEHERL